MSGSQEPIAVVGIGCRYPEADGPRDFWRLLLDGRCAVRDVPASRWDPLGVFDAEKPVPRRGAFLRDIRSFDAQFFKISPRGAELGAEYWARNLRDPVRFTEVIQGLARDGHRLFLEISPTPS